LSRLRPSSRDAAVIELSACVENLKHGAKIGAYIRCCSIEPSQADVGFMAKKASGSRFGVDIALFQPDEGNSVDVETIHHSLQASRLPFDRAVHPPLHSVSFQAEALPIV